LSDVLGEAIGPLRHVSFIKDTQFVMSCAGVREFAIELTRLDEQGMVNPKMSVLEDRRQVTSH